MLDELVQAIHEGRTQPPEHLRQFIDGVARGTVPNDEATQWLKAVHRHGCSVEDTVALTRCMMDSGRVLVWEDGPPVVDKHSTGGVGDKMSIALAPALAACGCRVPMLAGRGLGHTGGTIDKLESIPGFSCTLSPEAMQEAVRRVGCCIAVQNEDIAPADRILYALRDVTDTVDSIPLITASIVSKKAAEGLHALVLDVKTGDAAFMSTEDDARELARSMVETATGLGIQTVAQVTRMSHPIGTHIGNSLEIVESISILKGAGSPDTRELIVAQGAQLLSMAMDDVSLQEGRRRMERVLDQGQALEVFKAMCVEQGVAAEVVNRLIHQPTSVLGAARHQTTVLAKEVCTVAGVRAMDMAEMARHHGAGRFSLDDEIDPHVGFVVHCVVGQEVGVDDALLTFHHQRALSEGEMVQLQSLVVCSSTPIEPEPRLIACIESNPTKP